MFKPYASSVLCGLICRRAGLHSEECSRHIRFGFRWPQQHDRVGGGGDDGSAEFAESDEFAQSNEFEE